MIDAILGSRDLAAWAKAEEDLVDIFLGLFDTAGFQGMTPAHANRRVAELAAKVRRYVCSTLPHQLDFNALARDLGVGRHHLNRCFKEHQGVSLHDFTRLCRLNQARYLLMTPAPESSVTEAAYSCGFNHLGRFSTEYRQLFGETPRQTLRKAVQETQN